MTKPANLISLTHFSVRVEYGRANAASKVFTAPCTVSVLTAKSATVSHVDRYDTEFPCRDKRVNLSDMVTGQTVSLGRSRRSLTSKEIVGYCRTEELDAVISSAKACIKADIERDLRLATDMFNAVADW